MSSFVRFAGVAAVILSLGLFASALPVLSVNIPAVIGSDAVSIVCANVFADIDVKIKALLDCATFAELDVAAKVLVAVFQACADDLLNIGAGVSVAADAKLSIVACIASIIMLLVQVLVQVCLKFGIAATVALCAQVVTLCAQVNLNLCVELFTKVAGVVA
ncbi:hypothetical protein RSAG8_11549, partial [Rhizoctonia solani AG-8 WAC10335]